MAETPQPGDTCVTALLVVADRKMLRCLWILTEKETTLEEKPVLIEMLHELSLEPPLQPGL